MFHISKRLAVPRIVGMLLILLLLGQVTAIGQAPAAPNVCPAAPIDLPEVIEYDDFCVYYSLYDADTNPNGITAAQAATAGDHIEDYWDRYVTDFGHLPPTYADKMGVRLLAVAGCNGFVTVGTSYINVNNGCFAMPETIQLVGGHELYHQVQLEYDFDALWFHEGTARAIEDNVFDNIDNWATCMAADFSFNRQVNNYLANTNADVTSDPQRYNSCLWWKYFTEQYGSVAAEPELGVDAFVELWQASVAADDIAAVNSALTALGAATNFNTAFRRFVVANWTKDLTGVPDASYNYVDEDQVGNCAPYGPIVPHDGGTINIGVSATWPGNDPLGVPYRQVRRYGARYYSAQPGDNCPVVSASFHRIAGPDAFYHVVTQKGAAFDTHVEGSGPDWTQSFLNDGITQIVAIAGAQASSAEVDVTLECADPDIDIQLPNTNAKAQVQANTKFLAQVLVTNGSPTGPVVAGLTNSDFSARVGGVNAAITGGGFIQEQYWLVIRAPAGLPDDDYDLEIMLEEPGTDIVIDSDTEFDAIRYTTDLVDHVLVIDRSGSMGMPIEPTNAKLSAAKDAANFYVDITRNNDGLAVVAYNHDVDPAPFNMVSVNAIERVNATTYINDWSQPNGIFPDGATSIGDGLFEARNQRLGSPTGNPLCSFVLLSDGMENAERKWDTGLNPVKADVVATGCPVTTIAFGPASNETLMEDIASDTGGLSYFNDVYVSSLAQAPNATTVTSMTLELGDTYEYAQGESEGRQRLLAESGIVQYGETNTHTVMIDDSVYEVLFALDWYGIPDYEDLELILVKPDGTVYDAPATPYTFENYDNGHVGWRIPAPPTTTLEVGTWNLLVRRLPYATQSPQQQPGVPYKVLVSGQTDLTLNLLLPNLLGTSYSTGNRFPIYAILSNDGPIPCEGVEAIVTAPDGSKTLLPLFDDGKHGDGTAGDGVCANTYTRVNQSTVVQPPDEGVPDPPPAEDEGGYGVQLTAKNSEFQREAKGAFAVPAGEDDNNNGIPDVWEDENGVSDPNGDPDLDYLLNGDEYLYGTDPNNSDTDGGGENDGSEVDWSQDPLDPNDDEVEAPDFLQTAADNGKVQLTYDVKGEYVKLELWRAPAPDGPWNLRVSELPLGGAYEDPATNDTAVYYRLIGEDGDGHRTAVIASESVTPSLDPIPPEARVIINDSAASTQYRGVILTFEPYEYDMSESTESFDDITQMMLSNDPSFAGAQWQDLAQDVPWTLGGVANAMNYVYARFQDVNGNKSVNTEVGMIFYNPHAIYLPLILKNY